MSSPNYRWIKQLAQVSEWVNWHDKEDPRTNVEIWFFLWLDFFYIGFDQAFLCSVPVQKLATSLTPTKFFATRPLPWAPKLLYIYWLRSQKFKELQKFWRISGDVVMGEGLLGSVGVVWKFVDDVEGKVTGCWEVVEEVVGGVVGGYKWSSNIFWFWNTFWNILNRYQWKALFQKECSLLWF